MAGDLLGRACPPGDPRLDEIEGRYDRVLLAAAVALAKLGVVMVGPAPSRSPDGLGRRAFHYPVAPRGVPGGRAWCWPSPCALELKTIEQYSQLLLLACFVLLLAGVRAGASGVTVNGARRWINLGVSNFQTVEAVKLLFIVWLASYLVRYREQVQRHLVGHAEAAGRGRR
jgi:cell division protein FtsW